MSEATESEDSGLDQGMNQNSSGKNLNVNVRQKMI